MHTPSCYLPSYLSITPPPTRRDRWYLYRYDAFRDYNSVRDHLSKVGICS